MSVLYDLFEHSEAYAYAAGLLADSESAEEYDEALNVALKLVEDASANMQADAGAIARILRNLQAKEALQSAQAANFKKEYDRLNARAKATAAAIDRYKRAVCAAMEINGLARIKTDIGTWYTRDDIAVKVTDPYAIPQDFVKAAAPEADVNAIKKHFKFTGELLPGVEITTVKGAQFR